MAIFLPRRWTQQPQNPVRTVSDRGLVAAILPSAGVDYDAVVGGNRDIIQNNVSTLVRVALPQGRAIGSVSGTNQFYLSSASRWPDAMSGQSEVSIAVSGRLIGTGAAQPVLLIKSGSGLLYQPESSGAGIFRIIQVTFSDRFEIAFTIPQTFGTIVITWRAPNIVGVFVDGKGVDVTITEDDSISATATAHTGSKLVGSGSSFFKSPIITLAAMANRYWSDAQEISANPWQLFKRNPQRIFSFPADAGGGSLPIPVAMSSYRQRNQLSIG